MKISPVLRNGIALNAARQFSGMLVRLLPRVLFGTGLLLLLAGTASAAIGVDQTVSKDQGTASATVATAAFSTTSANELLLAFVSTDSPGTEARTQPSAVFSATGLTWALVRRTNTAALGPRRSGARSATSALTNVTVTATLSRCIPSSMTVQMSFTGVSTTGTNWSGAIGATGTGNSAKGTH